MTYRPLRDLVEARLARARGEEALSRSLPASAEPAVTPRGRDAAAPRWELAPIELDGVAGAHGQRAPVTATIPAGAIAAIVGPTGAGKTTLLRALLGLAPLHRGSVRYGGRSLAVAGVGP